MSSATLQTKPAEPAEIATRTERAHVHRDAIRSSWGCFGTDQIRGCTAHYAPEETEALIKLFLWCINPLHPMRREDAATRIGCSQDLIYQLMTGKYRNPDKSLKRPSPDFLGNLKLFLDQEEIRHRPSSNEFVLTPTARRVYTACELAMESHTPVILYGPSQIGKTWTLRNFTSCNNHGRTWMVELEAATGVGGLLRLMAETIGVGGGDNNNDARVERINGAISSDNLIILDEMHLMAHTYQASSFVRCVETIRRIYDRKKCGMVLCWTELKTLKNASHDTLSQIWRRGVHRIALPVMPTKADLTAILNHNGMEFPDAKLKITVGGILETPREILRQQARDNGLKAVTERVRYARKLAAKAGEPVDWKHFVDGHLRIAKQAEQEGEWF